MPRSTTASAAPLISNLNSLANGEAKSLGAFDFDVNNAFDFSVYVASQLAATGVGTDGKIEYYFIGSLDGTNWTSDIDPASIVDVSASLEPADLIFTQAANVNNKLVKRVFDVSYLVGSGYKSGCIIVKNLSGAATQATGNNALYAATNY